MVLVYNFNGERFEFEIDMGEAEQIINSLFAKNYQITEEQAEAIIEDLGVDYYDLAEDYEDELKDYFEDDAKDSYDDCLEYEKSPLIYNGFKWNEFQ